MKLVADTHFHTIASGHAYSTLQEFAGEASKKGLELIAITDHGPAFPNTTNELYFLNLGVIPKEINEVRILKGCEANIVDLKGNVDLPERILKRLDLVIASFHRAILKPGSKNENTKALLKIIKNPYIDIIGHPGNPNFPIDCEKIVKAAKEYGKIIEINNSSFETRKGSKENCTNIACLAKEYNVLVTTASDAHYSSHIGSFDNVIQILKSVDMPEKLVITTSKEKILEYLKSKGKTV